MLVGKPALTSHNGGTSMSILQLVGKHTPLAVDPHSVVTQQILQGRTADRPHVERTHRALGNMDCNGGRSDARESLQATLSDRRQRYHMDLPVEASDCQGRSPLEIRPQARHGSPIQLLSDWMRLTLYSYLSRVPPSLQLLLYFCHLLVRQTKVGWSVLVHSRRTEGYWSCKR